jgi:hypothetical protein
VVLVLAMGCRWPLIGHSGCPAFQKGIGATEQRAHRDHGWGDCVEGRLGERRIWLGANIGKSKLVERNWRQVQHAGAPRLFFPVNVIYIFVRVLRDPIVCLLQHVFPGAELEAVSRASLDAGWSHYVFVVLSTLFLAESLTVASQRSGLIGSVGAVGTLLYFWSE